MELRNIHAIPTQAVPPSLHAADPGWASRCRRFLLGCVLVILPLLVAKPEHLTNWIAYLCLVESVIEWVGVFRFKYMLLLMLYAILSDVRIPVFIMSVWARFA
jgi:hypothetical protein